MIGRIDEAGYEYLSEWLRMYRLHRKTRHSTCSPGSYWLWPIIVYDGTYVVSLKLPWTAFADDDNCRSRFSTRCASSSIDRYFKHLRVTEREWTNRRRLMLGQSARWCITCDWSKPRFRGRFVKFLFSFFFFFFFRFWSARETRKRDCVFLLFFAENTVKTENTVSRNFRLVIQPNE